MAKYILKRKFKLNSFTNVWNKIALYSILISIYVFLIFFGESESENNNEMFRTGLTILIIINTPLLSVFFLLNIIALFRPSENDECILLIAFNFLKSNEFSEQLILQYFESLTPKLSKKELNKFYRKYQKQDITIFGLCKHLSFQKAEIRLYVIYSLFDIASKDKILSITEEGFIEEISKLLKIPKNTYTHIKNVYLNKGLQEERKIIEEQNRKKLAESFLPYNAYKILGVSPTVTKSQLKKVYRTLAKKYHPDKYYGQSEETVQQAEDKFQEILEAYEIILKYKNFS